MKKENEFKMPDNAPFNSILLADIDTAMMVLGAAFRMHADDFATLAEKAQDLDETDAKVLKCEKQVHNIKNASTAVRMYAGIIGDLLQHINDDLKVIRDRRRQYAQTYAAMIAERQENERKNKNRLHAAEHKKERRAGCLEEPDEKE